MRQDCRFGFPSQCDPSAKARGVDVGQSVNELLRKDIELIEAAR